MTLALLLTWTLPAVVQAQEVRTPDAREGTQAWLQPLLVTSPYRLSSAVRHGVIEYQLRMDDIAWSWPRTHEQEVAVAGDTVLVRICRDCGDESRPDTVALERYSRSNAYIDSDTASVRAFARAHSRGRSTRSRMQSLANAVRQHMTGSISFGEYMTASAALAARSGDCTESAVLLAALARARGIPARVVSGIAYSSRFTGQAHVFSPHMWVQAWDGQRWTSYDAGLGAFDAGHIALHVGDGDPAGMPPLLEGIRRLRILDAYAPVPSTDADTSNREAPSARSSSVPFT
nr:transglutaminase-like domain-containing protein [uncultured Pseudoxanthomonas sp.]